jgi:dephospho-CoA kinase
VGRILAEIGVQVLDTDEVVHEMLVADHPVGRAVAERFGREVVGAGGRIDRRRVAQRVFASPDDLRQLNAIVHPAVQQHVRRWVEEATSRGGEVAVLIPLLFETNMTEGWDAILCVSASEEKVMERLRPRGWTEEETRRRMAAQWPTAEKERFADHVITNNGGREELKEETTRLWEVLRRKRSKDHV